MGFRPGCGDSALRNRLQTWGQERSVRSARLTASSRRKQPPRQTGTIPRGPEVRNTRHLRPQSSRNGLLPLSVTFLQHITWGGRSSDHTGAWCPPSHRPLGLMPSPPPPASHQDMGELAAHPGGALTQVLPACLSIWEAEEREERQPALSMTSGSQENASRYRFADNTEEETSPLREGAVW